MKIELGQIITEPQSKDAIHIAVIPAICSHPLLGGLQVALVGYDGKTVEVRVNSKKPIGVVDPFITGIIPPRTKFWLLMFPGSTQNLRHEWSHPELEAAMDEADLVTNHLEDNEDGDDWCKTACQE